MPPTGNQGQILGKDGPQCCKHPRRTSFGREELQGVRALGNHLKCFRRGLEARNARAASRLRAATSIPDRVDISGSQHPSRSDHGGAVEAGGWVIAIESGALCGPTNRPGRNETLSGLSRVALFPLPSISQEFK